MIIKVILRKSCLYFIDAINTLIQKCLIVLPVDDPDSVDWD